MNGNNDMGRGARNLQSGSPHGPGNSPNNPAHEEFIHINIRMPNGRRVDIAVSGHLSL